eukprot:2435927-Prymnesium_polylepis.1
MRAARASRRRAAGHHRARPRRRTARGGRGAWRRARRAPAHGTSRRGGHEATGWARSKAWSRGEG